MKTKSALLIFLSVVLALGLLILARSPSAPTVTVSTLAGGEQGFVDDVGSAARFNEPSGIAMDKAGNLYVTDTFNHRIRKISPEGEVSTFAGSGVSGNADGTGNAAQFDRPEGIAIDRAGNLYVTDRGNNNIRKITSKGEVSTLAGSKRGFADGKGSAAWFNWPTGIAIDRAGNLYVADYYSYSIRKVTPVGEVSTFVDGRKGSGPERLGSPCGIAIDAAGNLYVTASESIREPGTCLIRKITPERDWNWTSTFVGGKSGFADGIGGAARFLGPCGVAMDKAGNLYVADFGNHRIRKVSKKGEVSTLAGDGRQGFADGPGSVAQFNEPFGIAIDEAGNLYVADTSNHRIRKIVLK
ncbi:MAG: hypothetical protein LBV29_05940 [Azoarcus sp.]|jgi:DNA-binding beta-propeller fold protein YncE|nr:hypothetical protein [Azoarcus sp.]